MRDWHRKSLLRRLGHRLAVIGGSVVLTLGCFLVLPLTQVIGKAPKDDLVVRSLDTADAPPPPAVEPEPEPEREPPDEPPKLSENEQPLDLSQLEVALDAGIGAGWMGSDIGARLETVAAATDGADGLFSLADLDQKPRPIFRANPVLDPIARRKTPGQVSILFVVDPQGRVESARVQTASDPVFEKPALAAIRQWKFEPGRRKGQPVRFRMRLPMTFSSDS